MDPPTPRKSPESSATWMFQGNHFPGVRTCAKRLPPLEMHQRGLLPCLNFRAGFPAGSAPGPEPERSTEVAGMRASRGGRWILIAGSCPLRPAHQTFLIGIHGSTGQGRPSGKVLRAGSPQTFVPALTAFACRPPRRLNEGLGARQVSPGPKILGLTDTE